VLVCVSVSVHVVVYSGTPCRAASKAESNRSWSSWIASRGNGKADAGDEAVIVSKARLRASCPKVLSLDFSPMSSQQSPGSGKCFLQAN
jgi:hypothetical protein